jgi:hypothetical protein
LAFRFEYHGELTQSANACNSDSSSLMVYCPHGHLLVVCFPMIVESPQWIVSAMSKKDIQELLDRVADGTGYGDPDARLNDERKLQIFLAQEQSKVGIRLNWLTFFLVVVGLLNVAVLAFQVWGK